MKEVHTPKRKRGRPRKNTNPEATIPMNLQEQIQKLERRQDRNIIAQAVDTLNAVASATEHALHMLVNTGDSE